MAGKAGLFRFFALLGVSAKMDLHWLLRDTRYALAGILSDMISNLGALAGVYLIALRFGGIGGMGEDEILFMLAYSTLVTGLFTSLGAANNFHISRVIGRGQMEHMFVQPLSLPVQLLTCGFAPFTGGGNILVGGVLLAVSIRRLALEITAGWVLLYAVFTLASLTVIVARSYLVSTAAFYAPAAAEEISTTVIDDTWLLSTYPLSGMPGGLQVALITVLPEGLLAWFPSLCLLGRPPLGLSELYLPAFALILSLVAGQIFKRGLNHYVTYGTNRYLPHSFRR